MERTIISALAEFRRHLARSLIHWGLWWLALTIFSSALWIRNKFGAPTFDQFLFHVELGFSGLLNAEFQVIKSFVVSSILLPGLAAFVLSSGLSKIKKFYVGPVASLILACAFLLNQVSFFAYAQSRTGQDYFSAHYLDPRQVALSANSPRNLVLIYVESLDATYSNTELFGRNLLHSLDASAMKGQSFSRYSQMPGTGWTIAAIASTQCGVPLQAITLYDGNVQGEKLRHFLPGAVCLGDVLNDFGYRNVFMGGASLAFAGKGQFLEDHHYQERYGREEWIAKGEDPDHMSNWGLQDDDLFRNAKAEVDKLESSGGRFNLTLLTLDTHYSGTEALSKYCTARGVKDFGDLVECTADQVADFVDYVRQKGYLENLDIVVVGDHVAMTNPLISRLTRVPERHIFNLFVSKDLARKSREDIVHFDLFPTILDFIGIHVPNGQLALGYSGFSFSDPRLSADRLTDMRRNLDHPSPLYFGLWKPSDTERRS